MGGGSWATALAHLFMHRNENIVWYMRRRDRIDEFMRLGHNPAYLTDLHFDTSRITFTDDINEACRRAGTLLLAMPSPYFKEHMAAIDTPIDDKVVITAIKGLVPGDNQLVTDYMHRRFHVPARQLMVVSGPCHAEEVALDRPVYLTMAGNDPQLSEQFASQLRFKNAHCVTSCDVDGIEYAGVLKNVYALAAGIIHGLKRGDNLQAVMMSNAVREMQRFLQAVVPTLRNICDSVYLGDLLVTAYSRFSRNHNFGSIIGRGYSVKSARMEMEQTAEGYFGTKCMYELNRHFQVEMPILDTVYDILYRQVSAHHAIDHLSLTFT